MEDLVRKADPIVKQGNSLSLDFDDDLALLETKPKKSKLAETASSEGGKQSEQKSIRDANREKLQALEMKRNEMRAKAKEAREMEAKRVVSHSENGEAKNQKSDRQIHREREKAMDENLLEKGIDPERYRRLHQTQESLEGKNRKDKRKRDGETPDSSLNLLNETCYPGFGFFQIFLKEENYTRQLFACSFRFPDCMSKPPFSNAFNLFVCVCCSSWA
jgi:hypothetical protein